MVSRTLQCDAELWFRSKIAWYIIFNCIVFNLLCRRMCMSRWIFTVFQRKWNTRMFPRIPKRPMRKWAGLSASKWCIIHRMHWKWMWIESNENRWNLFASTWMQPRWICEISFGREKFFMSESFQPRFWIKTGHCWGQNLQKRSKEKCQRKMCDIKVKCS